ncbi:MAG: HD-GYP domain-containing protein [Desulfovibrionaceae bacterium]|nr:HD-GYP domain-containing protein [Desulfovibrionaceae bacterium]
MSPYKQTIEEEQDANKVVAPYPWWPPYVLAIFCSFCVIVARAGAKTIFFYAGIPFSYTDFFVLISAGLGGLGCGLLTFVILSTAEFLRYAGDYGGLYSMSTYLILILLMSRLSLTGWCVGLKKYLLSLCLLSSILALCWYLTFTVLTPEINFDNFYVGLAFWKLWLAAVPETALALLSVVLINHLSPAKWSLFLRLDKTVKPAGRQVLGVRIMTLALLEAALLCSLAIICTAMFTAAQENVPFSGNFLCKHWREHLRLGLTMMCAAVPLACLFNLYIVRVVIEPIKAMSSFMESYYAHEESDRARKLPALTFKSHNEIENLYLSLQKMVADVGTYLEREIEQERKSAHLTQGFMLALAKAVDAKDRYTSGHSTRVASYAREIAKRLGKSEEEQEKIYVLGLLHDIGKIGVPEAIINKNGRLTEEEYAIIKQHPVMGFEILKNVTELPRLATGARWHHERFDGKGYPDGLARTDIPEEARIIAVADAYDAMTSKRAYSEVRPQAKVRAEIERCCGSQFDPHIAEIMLGMIDEDKSYTMHEGSEATPPWIKS